MPLLHVILNIDDGLEHSDYDIIIEMWNTIFSREEKVCMEVWQIEV